jgi:hypothetical protein
MENFTGNKDVDLIILDKLDDRTLFYVCGMNQKDEYVNRICNDDYFWMNRLRKTYGDVAKIQPRTWKNLYLGLVYFLDKYENTFNLNEINNESENLSLPFVLEIAKKNDWDVLYYFINNKRFNNIEVIVEGAAEAGNIFMVNHFIRDEDLETAIFHSAKGGHRELTDDLINRALLLEEKTKEMYVSQINGALFGAAAGGQEELAKYYIAKGANDWSLALEGALRSGNEKLIDLFLTRLNVIDAAIVIASNGYISLLKKVTKNASKNDIDKIRQGIIFPFYLKKEIAEYLRNFGK